MRKTGVKGNKGLEMKVKAEARIKVPKSVQLQKVGYQLICEIPGGQSKEGNMISCRFQKAHAQIKLPCLSEP